MKLFSLVASALGLAYATEDVADAGWQDASDADVKTWKGDVLHAASTVKQIKNKMCQLPKGKSLQKLGNPKNVLKHYYKLSNGNTRATYEFKFADGTIVYAGNANVGQKGGNWKVYCYRQGHDMATKSPHHNDLDSSMTARLRALFKSVDRDGSGTITSGGAYSALSQIFGPGSLPNFEETLNDETIRAAGKDKKVDLDEFECVAKKLYNIKKVYDEFKQYDKNHDNKMSRNELETALIKYYLKDVAQPGLIQTAVTRAKVKKLVDDIIKHHDKNHDSQVSFKEFETDAFAEAHYKPNGKCQTSSTPLNKHEISVVENLIKKFKGTKKEVSHSSWYQITSMLTEQSIDKMNGAVKPPALGCWHKKPGNQKPGNQKPGNQKPGNQNKHNNPFGSGSGSVGHYFGQNGGNRFGRGGQKDNGQDRYPVAGGRVLLRRFLQGQNFGRPQNGQNGQRPNMRGGGDQNGQRPNKNGQNGQKPNSKGPNNKNDPKDKKERKEMMSLKQALAALHKQADENHDGSISDHEILDIFQGVRNHLSTSDFGSFLDMVNKIKGPVNCGVNKDCGKCTDVKNAGLCGWFAESRHRNPFGGYVGGGSGGNCKFVDRTRSAEQYDGADTAKPTTCSYQCKSKNNKNNKKPQKPQKPQKQHVYK